MLKIALLILTLTPDGATRLTLTEAEDADDCGAKREVVSQVLTEAGSPPIAALCDETALRLTPFEHGLPPDAETHRYRVELPKAGGFVIRPLTADETCEAETVADPAVHCTRSAQAELPDG